MLEATSSTADVEGMLKAEISILKALDHPHVVKMKEALEDENSGKVYLVMDYCSKGTVLSKDYWKAFEENQNVWLDLETTRKLPLNIAREYFVQIASAVDYMHNQALVIHHDIKPDNILVDASDQIKVTDFGISIKLSPGESDVLTNYGWGTKSYLPPEAWKSKLDLPECNLFGRCLDMWALGCTFYELVYGVHPFCKSSTDLRHLEKSIIEDE